MAKQIKSQDMAALESVLKLQHSLKLQPFPV